MAKGQQRSNKEKKKPKRILDQNALTVEAKKIKDVKVIETITEGKTICRPDG